MRNDIWFLEKPKEIFMNKRTFLGFHFKLLHQSREREQNMWNVC